MCLRALLSMATLLLTASAAGCGGDDPRPVPDRGSSAKLRWAPPELEDPVSIQLDDGYSSTRLPTSQDAVLHLPSSVKRGAVTIEGGHDVVIVGGRIAIPAGTPSGTENNRFRTGIYIKGATGTVHVEGVRLSAAEDVEWDAIAIAAPEAVVQLENIRADRLRGTYEGLHADVIQPWGGVKSLRVDRLTASTNYQGITIPVDLGPIGRAQLSNVNLRGLAEGVEGGGHLLWLTSGNESCDSYPVELRNVFIEPRPEAKFSKAFWPQLEHPPECGARTRDGVATWPQLPDVEGEVLVGPPPRGSFVPLGRAGLEYVSPGYRRR